MLQLSNKQVVLGVTGGIAAYKSAELLRKLQEAGAIVRVVMTKAATEFITPLTMQALSGKTVHLDLLDTKAEAAMGHIELARWADLILVAPASANFIARIAGGRADDLLTTLCLASKAPLALAPAMNQGMWLDPQTQTNLKTLKKHNVTLLGPAEGEQACGDIGPGRMLEPIEIATKAAQLFDTGALAGLTVVITSGPTREAIDPVRYISNHSSGKMGFALAEAAADAGARTILIAGPVNLECSERIKRINVVSAQQMFKEAMAQAPGCDVFIAAAAVADYRPIKSAEQKIKKYQEELAIDMIRNPDIIASVAALKDRPFTVGFAAETENLLAHARTKLEKKGLDMVIANDVSQAGIGFNSDQNAVTVVSAKNELHFPTAGKSQLATQLISQIDQHLKDKISTSN